MENLNQVPLIEQTTSRSIEYVNGQVQPADAVGRLEKDAYLQTLLFEDQYRAYAEGRHPAVHIGARAIISSLVLPSQLKSMAGLADRVGIDEAITIAGEHYNKGSFMHELVMTNARDGRQLERSPEEIKFFARKLREKKDERELLAYGGKLPIGIAVTKKLKRAVGR